MWTLEKRGNLFFLTLAGNDQHRLSPTTMDSILSALSQAKSQATRGSALITISEGRFFSNGFDLDWARAAGSEQGVSERVVHMVNMFKLVVAAFLSLPMPTIAAVTGHAAGAGLVLALCHDYIFVRRNTGVLYMPEIDLGLTIPEYLMVMLKAKIGSAAARRDLMLCGMKMKGEAAAKMGIVEAAYDSEESVREASVSLAETLSKRGWDGEVYSAIRKGLYPEACGILGLVTVSIMKPRL